jgi:hypothetical protein
VSKLTSARRHLGLFVDVVFVRGRSFSFAGGHFHLGVVVFVRGRSSSFAGGRFCSWAVVFVRMFSLVGGPLRSRALRWSFPVGGGCFCSWAVVFVSGQLFLFVGGCFCS